MVEGVSNAGRKRSSLAASFTVLAAGSPNSAKPKGSASGKRLLFQAGWSRSIGTLLYERGSAIAVAITLQPNGGAFRVSHSLPEARSAALGSDFLKRWNIPQFIPQIPAGDGVVSHGTP